MAHLRPLMVEAARKLATWALVGVGYGLLACWRLARMFIALARASGPA